DGADDEERGEDRDGACAPAGLAAPGDRLELGGELPRPGPPVARVLGEEPEDERVERRGKPRDVRPRRARDLLDVLREDGVALPLEGRPPRDEVVERGPERVEVGARADDARVVGLL